MTIDFHNVLAIDGHISAASEQAVERLLAAQFSTTVVSYAGARRQSEILRAVQQISAYDRLQDPSVYFAESAVRKWVPHRNAWAEGKFEVCASLAASVHIDDRRDILECFSGSNVRVIGIRTRRERHQSQEYPSFDCFSEAVDFLVSRRADFGY